MARTIPTVRMKHPKVKPQADVPVSAVPFHERAGWTRVEPAAKAPAQDKPAVKAPAKSEREDG